MLTKIKPSIEKNSQPLVTIFANVSPNILTSIGSIPPVLFFVCMLLHWYIPGLLVYLFTALDLLDGMVARRFNRVSNAGAFLDSTLDRVSDFFIITAFGASGLVGWGIVICILALSFLISYIRSRAEALASGIRFDVGFAERTERLVILYAGLLLFVLFPYVRIFGYTLVQSVCIVLVLILCVTLMQRFRFAFNKLR